MKMYKILFFIFLINSILLGILSSKLIGVSKDLTLDNNKKDSIISVLHAKDQSIAVIEPHLKYISNDSIYYSVIIRNPYTGTIVSDCMLDGVTTNIESAINNVNEATLVRFLTILQGDYPCTEFQNPNK